MQGLFDLINIPFSWVIRFFYGLTDNYMVALLFFAIVVKLVLFPIGIKTQKNMVKQASLRPKEADVWVDRTYILAAMGLLSSHYPAAALRIMKKELEYHGHSE